MNLGDVKWSGNSISPYPDYNLSIIEGNIHPQSLNVLRLDGMYFDSALGVEGNRQKNQPIFDAAIEHDVIVFQSHHSKKLCTSFGIRVDEPGFPSSTVIYNGVDMSIFNPDITNIDICTKPTFVACASWRRHKRLEEIIAAFSHSKLANANLLVVGAYDQRTPNPYVTKIPSNVKFLGEVSNRMALAEIYKKATGMIHLCWLDSCPNSVVEAIACGLPVLCSSNGGTKELVGKNGIVIHLEEPYEYGTMVDLYNPPMVDIEPIVQGILNLEDFYTPPRPDLDIRVAAHAYRNILRWA